jgi:hypothetical protein
MIAFTVAVAVCSKMHKKEQQATLAISLLDKKI